MNTETKTVDLAEIKKTAPWIMDHIDLLIKRDSEFKGGFKSGGRIAKFRIWRSKENKSSIAFTGAVMERSIKDMEVIYRASFEKKTFPWRFIELERVGSNYELVKIERK